MLRDRSLTARQVAERLGRSLSAVEQARIAYAEGVPLLSWPSRSIGR